MIYLLASTIDHVELTIHNIIIYVIFIRIHNRSCRADNPSRRVSDSVNRFSANINKQFEDQFQASGGSSEQTNMKCSECGRSFNSVAYARHTQICRKVFGGKRKVFDSAKARAKGTEMAAYYQRSVKNNSGNSIGRPSGVRKASEFSGNRELAAAYNLRDRNKEGQKLLQKNDMPKWKRDSLAFRQAMRAARAYDRETSNVLQPTLKGRDNNLASRGRGSSAFPNKSIQSLSAVGSNNLLNRSVQKVGGVPYYQVNNRQNSETSNKSSRIASNLGYQQQQQFEQQYKPAIVDPSYLQCPHCNRSFNEKAGERHIPQCRGIINKPSRLTRGSGVPSHSTSTF